MSGIAGLMALSDYRPPAAPPVAGAPPPRGGAGGSVPPSARIFMFSSALRELCGLLRPVRFAGGVVRQHRVVEEERVDELRGGRRHRPRLERAVIEIVRPAFSHGLGVGVGELGLSHQDLAADGTHGAEFTVLARGDRARDPQPLADIAELADALPHFGGGTVDGDFQRNGDVGRRGDRAADRGGRRSLSRRRRSLCAGGSRQTGDRERAAGNGFTNCLRMESSNRQILIPNTGGE